MRISFILLAVKYQRILLSLLLTMFFPVLPHEVKSSALPCPSDINTLGNALVKDLPDYTNRILQKNSRADSLPVYVITASLPEFEPLPLTQTQYRSQKTSEIRQIFFTTLERHYSQNQTIYQTQNYYWLLLTPTPKGWEMVTLLTKLGHSQQDTLITPPFDNSNGVTGAGIKTWLRDQQFSCPKES
ncbi:MAG: hypothetical protein IGQ45_12050 [Cyanobacterium sp. T60_A2020_053]|nr:hypothetical protein [Cyanobacterium sp. T60_A2020_053]